MDKCSRAAEKLRREFKQFFRDSQTFLSEWDFIRFARSVSEIDEKQRKRLTERNQRNLALLKKRRYGSLSASYDTIINLSNLELSNIQKDVLCRGVDFGIPHQSSKEEVLCEFEVFYRSLAEFSPASKAAVAQCRSSLEGLAHEYANKENDLRSFSLTREHMKALKDLRRNDTVVVTKPDKGRATVILNRADYVEKMMTILNDGSKFVKLGPVDTHDRTSNAEASLNGYLSELRSTGEITDELFDSVRSVGATRPRLYGLPKIHKTGNPLRPILSVTGSPQFHVSQWLCRILDPVLKMYNTRCVKDSFAFIDLLKENAVYSSGHMCSFDVVSLFTNVPLEETIDICANALYRNDDAEPTALSEDSFRTLLRTVTSGVEFSFNGTMYRQIDGVAMGSPLGPVLANIFVGYWESCVPDKAWPSLYCRFVDNSFAYFESRQLSKELLDCLNNLPPSSKFTCEHEENGRLPFMDVLVEKSEDDTAVTSVYRKPTFTGLYITWDSYCSTKYKVNLVKSLVHRAKRLCSSSKLKNEMDTLKSIFIKNGYPEDLLAKLIVTQVKGTTEYGPRRCPVYLRLPWKGQWSSYMARTITSVARSAYYAVDVRVVYSTSRAFHLTKDVLPTHHKSNVIYQFECRRCESRYVGRTVQRLNARIRQHVPLHLLTTSTALAQRPTRGRPRKNPKVGPASDSTPALSSAPTRTCPPRKCKAVASSAQPGGKTDTASLQSAVARHLAENKDCANQYDDTSFRVLCQARTRRCLEVLEVLYIRSINPTLCIQKQTLSTLRLFRAPEPS